MMRDPDLARDSDLPGKGIHTRADGTTFTVRWLSPTSDLPGVSAYGWYWADAQRSKSWHGPYLTDHAAAQAGLDAGKDS